LFFPYFLCQNAVVSFQLMKPVDREPKSARPLLNEVAFDRIKRDILTCALGPGEQVTEAQLAERYQMGRAPIRAALLGLAQAGLVRAIPRRGYLIAPITTQDVQDVTQLRLLLEPTAAKLASGRLSDTELKRMESLCTVKCAPVEKFGARAIAAHRELHMLISRACGNQRLTDAISTLYDDVERLMQLGVTRVHTEEMSGYKPLVQALAANDGETAAALMVDQIELGRNRILDALFAGRLHEELIESDGGGEMLSIQDFVRHLNRIFADQPAAETHSRVADKLKGLLRNPLLLSTENRRSSPHSYRRHVLHVDPDGRFSVVAIVWEEGQSTPVFRSSEWSVTGVYEGELREASYHLLSGSDGAGRLLPGGVTHHGRGGIFFQDGHEGNLQRLDNPASHLAITVHVYGFDVRGTAAGLGECYFADDMESAKTRSGA
jgi:DNA-binding GntR family transcriptional regulator/predicted metal-dependent enzyme (double-stranded beta helix superfamily)